MLKERKTRARLEAFAGKQFILLIYTMLKRHYPDLNALLNTVPDHRKRHSYEVAEILAAGILMFVLRCESRNHLDQQCGEKFEENYLRIFGMKLPVTDTVYQFLEKLPSRELDKLRELLVRRLMERKVFDKWKFEGYYNLSFDGTGTYTFDDEPFENCPYKETKSTIKYYASVLEAKLIFSNGFSISLASEWLENQNGQFDKQDCEQAAFKRLATKVKATFPRLAVLVSADGLYCCEPMMELIQSFGWKFIFTFKDNSLKSVWKQLPDQDMEVIERPTATATAAKWEEERLSFTNGLTYQGYCLSFVEYVKYEGLDPQEYLCRHVHLTDIKITSANVLAVSQQGRLRWKIENEGFNTQKNGGYALGHKYARKDFNAMKNYYLLMQIGHMISQLIEKLQVAQKGLKQAGRTIKSWVEDALAEMKKGIVSLYGAMTCYLNHKQLRY